MHMSDLVSLGAELEDMLRLRTKIVAYKKLERADDLDKISGVTRINYRLTFCQVPDMVRTHRLTVGITKDDEMGARCMNLCGLSEANDDSIWREAAVLTTTWFHSHEEALQQQADYPRMSAGEAIVLAPLTDGKFEPEVLIIYGSPAQIMMIMCGLQKQKYEPFSFSFISEGDCVNAVSRCCLTGKPAVGLACYGERAIGQVLDDEIYISLPPSELERAVLGLRELFQKGLRYPIRFLGAEHDPYPEVAEFYPPEVVEEAILRLSKR